MPLCPIENVWIVTSASYVDIVRRQLPDMPQENILSEPCARNTAPCIAYACWKIKSKCPSANIVVTPADALIIDVDNFREVIRTALEYASGGERIVTVGITPTRPETGYGYIQASPDLSAYSQTMTGSVIPVSSFKEKPSLDIAKLYLAAGNYYWNAGIFVWNVNTIVNSIRHFTPDLAEKMDKMAEAFYTRHERETVEDIFPTCEKISIDYAVMEKADYIYTIPGDFGWSDVGTWGSLWTLLPHDEDGNAVVGKNVHLYNCKGCIVHAPGAASVVLEGMEDSIIVEREGRILVCSLKEEQRIKDFEK